MLQLVCPLCKTPLIASARKRRLHGRQRQRAQRRRPLGLGAGAGRLRCVPSISRIAAGPASLRPRPPIGSRGLSDLRLASLGTSAPQPAPQPIQKRPDARWAAQCGGRLTELHRCRRRSPPAERRPSRWQQQPWRPAPRRPRTSSSPAAASWSMASGMRATPQSKPTSFPTPTQVRLRPACLTPAAPGACSLACCSQALPETRHQPLFPQPRPNNQLQCTADHYTGLSERWEAGPIYCSALTARLIAHMLGVHPRWLRPLPLDAATNIQGARRRKWHSCHWLHRPCVPAARLLPLPATCCHALCRRSRPPCPTLPPTPAPLQAWR